MRFRSVELDRLEVDPTYTGRFDPAVVRAYRKTLAIIRAADSQMVFVGLPGLRFERLRRRRDEYSMRLNRQWRLIVSFEGEASRTVVILGVEDYH